MTGTHDIRQCEQAPDLVFAWRGGRGHEGSVRVGNADALALSSIHEGTGAVVGAPPPTVQARGTDAIEAVDAGVVAVVERRDHEVTAPHSRHIDPDLLDDTDELVADSTWSLGGGHPAVGPQV